VGVEIERKFLVASDAWRALGTPVLLRQGYLNADPARTVRVRIEGQGRALPSPSRARTSAPRAASGNTRSRCLTRPNCSTACASAR
jgi:hypothetical protein